MSKKPVVVRLKKGKKQFEILVNHGTVEKYREGKLGWNKVAYVDQVYKNSSKGDRATTSDLKAQFKTNNIDECMQIIAKTGDLQLTSSDRKEKLEQRRKQILNHIHKYYIDPKTNKSHPMTRIENALQQLKIKINMEQSVEKQVQTIVRKLPEALPIRKCEMNITVDIPSKYVGQSMGVISKGNTQILSQNYSANGCRVSLSCVPGDYDKLANDLNSVTKGECVIDIGGSTSSKQDNKKSKRKKKKKGKGGRNTF